MNTLSVWCWVFNFNFNFFFKNPNQEKNNNKWYENLRDIKKCRNYPSCPLTEVLFLYFPIRSSIQVPFKFHSSFVSLLGTSQIFHLALHFIQRGLKKYRCNFHDVICHLVLISLIGFFLEWIIKKHKDLLVLVSWVFNIEDQLKWKLTKKLNK